ncbi:TonB-dependent receptor [Spongiibacter sp. KMU-166]|uniref:TonB-dependent receptor n=1 Tax=Spongiibacter thalassae TaxID=2721624 RepID=A0ABX1GD55_9GAMM|nr:TonB-dependent receptor [Spongiibacter thalassae]NKI16523.1 TonB-dependent receptor [Spongiibacter thalassae]
MIDVTRGRIINTIFPFVCVLVTTLTNASEEKKLVVEEVVVTAQKRAQSIQDVPISINVYSGEKMAEMKIERLDDLALNEPSLTLSAGLSPTSLDLGMRGFSSLVLGSGIQPPVSLVIDGVPLAMGSEFAMELADIQRIEVLKGPQGTLFGGNAVGGLINIVRNRPDDESIARVDVDISNDDEYIVRVIAGGPLGDNFGGRIFAYNKDREGHVTNLFPGSEKVGGVDEYGFVAKLAFEGGEGFDGLLTGDFREFESFTGLATTVSDGPQRDAAVGGDRVYNDPYTINQNQDTYGTLKNWGLTFEANWELSDSLLLTSVSSYRNLSNVTTLDLDASPASATNKLDMPFVYIPDSNISTIGDKTGKIDTHYWAQEFRLQKTTESFDLISGVFYRDFTQLSPAHLSLLVRADSLVDAPSMGLGVDEAVIESVLPMVTGGASGYLAIGLAGDSELTRQEVSVFSDLTYHLASNIDVFAGFRLHRDKVGLVQSARQAITPGSEPFFSVEPDKAIFNVIAVDQITSIDSSEVVNEWAGRIGASWFANSDTNIYTTLSRGFIGTGVDAGPTSMAGSEYLEPTTSVSLEVGLKTSFMDGRLTTNAAIFRQENQDVMVSLVPPGELAARPQNIGSIDSTGLELTMAFVATENLSFNASVTVLDTATRDQIDGCYDRQTEAEGCNIDTDDDGEFESQSTDGNSSIGTPDLAYTISSRYVVPRLTDSVNGFISMSYNWRDEVQYRVDANPLTVQEAYGLLDMSVGITELENKYSVSMFGKNLLDTYFAAGKTAGENTLGRSADFTPRQGRFYWGVKAMYSF